MIAVYEYIIGVNTKGGEAVFKFKDNVGTRTYGY